MPNLDIHTGIITALIIAILIMVFAIYTGIRALANAKQLKFFRMRRDRMVAGWRLIGIGLVMLPIILLLRRFAEPIAYRFFPPTSTLTSTPTTTLTPTMTLTFTISPIPSQTDTPSTTDTPTITPTPHIPLAVEAQFTSVVTPNPEAIFSPLIFTQALDENYDPINPSEKFINPVKHLYAWFTYDKMLVNSQWSALWYRNGELVYFETKPWDGSQGGRGYTDWNPLPFEWLPGIYEVQVYVGLSWKVSGTFTIEGEPPPPPPSSTPSPTVTPTPTVSPTPTSSPTKRPTDTRQPTLTYTPRPTTATLKPPNTHAPSPTPAPPTVTNTHAPTPTSGTPTPTQTRWPTATSRH